MISRDSLASIGEIHKPHGVKGEVSATLDDPDLDPATLPCLVLEMDGLPVPFFLDTARRRGEAAWLLKFDTIDSEAAAARIARHEIFALRSDLPDSDTPADGVYLHDLAGFSVADAAENTVGTVVRVDDSTANTLLIIARPDGSQALVPFSDDLLLWLDTATRSLGLEIPDGVLDLNSTK